MPLDRPLDAFHLCNIYAHTNDQDVSSAPKFGPTAHSDYTGSVVSPTKTLKPKRKVRGIEILQVPALTKIPWLIHGFSTRLGGVTPLDSEKVLNLGFTDWDTRKNVLENRRRFQFALGATDLKLISLMQIHSDVIHLFDAAPAEPCRGDASTTNRSGLLLGVQTADCVPILLVDPKKRAVAAVQFQSQFSDAPEWFDEFRTGDEPNPIQWLNMMPPGHQPPPKNVRLDLKKANRAQLLGAGLRAPNIFVSDLCTACRRDLLFCYRKEGAQSGRLMSVIGILT